MGMGEPIHRKYKIFAKTAIECLTRGIYLSNYVVARIFFFAKNEFVEEPPQDPAMRRPRHYNTTDITQSSEGNSGDLNVSRSL